MAHMATSTTPATNSHSTNPPLFESYILLIDLDSNESYIQFLHQIKELGMTKSNYQYVLLTLVF